MTVITVAAPKGGVGKTTLSYELAAALGAVLVDLDWDQGGATAMWGWDPCAPRRRARLVDALKGGEPPRALRAPGRPALIPSHPDLATLGRPMESADVDWCLSRWARSAGRPLVVDTHPGVTMLGSGALAAADVVVVPTVLGQRELDAMEWFMEKWTGDADGLVLVPMMVPAVPPRTLLRRLRAIATVREDVVVAPPIGDHRILRRRARRTALCLEPRPGAAVRRARDEFCAVADCVRAALGDQ